MRTRLADGFDQPVGKPDAEGYYISRGFRARYHMGEDWNGLEGGNSDLGKPVYATANGVVVLARNMRMGWGNLVIIRHIFLEEKQMKTVDSVYAHLDRIFVSEGKQIVRGQQIGTIGTNRGMYIAHLHFEIRKNIFIGYNQRAFAKDLGNYYVPGAFIAQHRKLHGGGRSALVAVNTFNLGEKGALAMDGTAGRSETKPEKGTSSSSSPSTPAKKKDQFRVNRFGDLFWNQ
jgi:murein DD-endopeptidase MepM/ murein hydrolase activator NlpD